MSRLSSSVGKAKALALVLFGVAMTCLASSSAQAVGEHWNVILDLRPSTVDWNTGPTGGCGTVFKNTDTFLSMGNFQRCAGGVPGADNRAADANHLSHVARNMGSYTIPAWAWNGGAVLRFEDPNGDGVIANGAAVTLIWFSNEQHGSSAGTADVRVHMHTRGVMADTPDSANCPSTIAPVDGSAQGSITRTVTCMGSYNPTTYQAVGSWNTASNRVDWSTVDTDPGAGVVYAGQMKNVHNFGYVDCNSSAFNCTQGALSVGLNWKQGYADWQVAKIAGTAAAEAALPAFTFTGTVNFTTATSSLYFTTPDILVDSANAGNTDHNSWWNMRGSLYQAVYVPEPGTALLVLGGLIGLVASRRRQS